MKHDREPTAVEARSAMIAALRTVSDHLSAPALEGIDVAARSDDIRENEVARVKLWGQIKGREQSDDPEVLCTRLAITVLHPTDIAQDVQTCLEYFTYWFRRAGLPETALSEVASMEAHYNEA